MRYQLFTIPVHGGDEQAADLDRFLSSHRIMEVDRRFINDGACSAWCFCVGFLKVSPVATTPRSSKVDYREILNDADFACFARMRTARKEISESAGLPAYSVFTNEQLAQMVQKRVRSLTELRTIPGVGEARASRYGKQFLAILVLQNAPGEAP